MPFSWFRSKAPSTSKRARKAASKKPIHKKVFLELLEDRITPATTFFVDLPGDAEPQQQRQQEPRPDLRRHPLLHRSGRPARQCRQHH